VSEETTTTQPEVTVEQVVAAISQQIEISHGGWVEFVDFDGKILQVRLQGACVGCPMSQYTLAMGIGQTVKQFFPELEAVQAVP
jgi:Fe-S cluster biogenesis protein NfuA